MADTAREFLATLQRHGVQLGLDRMRLLLDRLGRPQERFLSVHIGGTNGKGSTAAMTASMLGEAGYRVGLYTSPHLIDVRERIRLGAHLIPDGALAAMTEQVRRVSEDLSVTFFEFTTALAFQYYAQQAVEIAVIEVGMGGRFDATNVLAPIACAITTVALDHQAELGGTLSAIAFEKAGIIKPRTPVVLGTLPHEAMAVIEPLVAARGARAVRVGYEVQAHGDPLTGFHYRGLDVSYDHLTCPLPGQHQVANAACALALGELVNQAGLRVSSDAVRRGLERVWWEGLLEHVPIEPPLLLDGAHNPAGADVLARYLRDYRARHGVRHLLLLSIMGDKEADGIVAALLPVVDEVIVTTARICRAMSVQELRTLVLRHGATPHVAASAHEALRLAQRLATPSDLICVTGSLMLVGEVKAVLRGCEVSPLRG